MPERSRGRAGSASRRVVVGHVPPAAAPRPTHRTTVVGRVRSCASRAQSPSVIAQKTPGQSAKQAGWWAGYVCLRRGGRAAGQAALAPSSSVCRSMALLGHRAWLARSITPGCHLWSLLCDGCSCVVPSQCLSGNRLVFVLLASAVASAAGGGQGFRASTRPRLGLSITWAFWVFDHGVTLLQAPFSSGAQRRPCRGTDHHPSGSALLWLCSEGSRSRSHGRRLGVRS